MVVHPSHFRKGIGAELLRYVENIEIGIDEIIISTGAKNMRYLRE
ncbi:GNAT family N-acetyltransferase [Ammoniphilus sp. CFH 90114]|nr:N-acetyltransferase [Ammoniphilus sp. CFH 90114]